MVRLEMGDIIIGRKIERETDKDDYNIMVPKEFLVIQYYGPRGSKDLYNNDFINAVLLLDEEYLTEVFALYYNDSVLKDICKNEEIYYYLLKQLKKLRNCNEKKWIFLQKFFIQNIYNLLNAGDQQEYYEMEVKPFSRVIRK